MFLDRDDIIDLANDISVLSERFEIMMRRADDILQHDEAPEPYDQWEAAADAAQSCCGLDFDDHVSAVLEALYDMAEKLKEPADAH